MTDIKMYLVGGAVRDFYLGARTKDYDYSVVMDSGLGLSTEEAFSKMLHHLHDEGFNVFLSTPEHLTVRAQFPVSSDYDSRRGLTADFVLSRKEGPYSDGRRPDWTTPGTLEDDLSRRDFSVNAMALDSENNLIDMFGGREDLDKRVLRAVGDPAERLTEDALRAFRAIRFAITKGFTIDSDLEHAMKTVHVLDALEENISAERIQAEMHKCFVHSTVETISFLWSNFPMYLGIMERKGIWLRPTLGQKK